ncbi:response regulator [Arthrobacter sp. MMS24-S77]
MNHDGVITVMLVDDQPLLRAGFRFIIENEESLQVVAEASDGAEAIELATKLKPDVILMDIRMPNMDGIEATRIITAANTTSHVVILTTFDLDEYAFEGLHAGASAFLLKDASPTELINAIHIVSSGDSVVAPRITKRLVETYIRGNATGHAKTTPSLPDPLLKELTPRETEILKSLAEGLSNPEIAHRYVLAESTVKTHIHRVLTKLHLRDRIQAVVYAYETGLVTPSNPDY